MLSRDAFQERTNAIDHAIEAGEFADAERALVALHVAVHEQASFHQRVHLQWFRLGRARRSAGAQVAQVLPILFAVPVSLAHRYLGLAVGRHRARHTEQ